jgi:myo-inositol catabolism protein IolC
MTVDMLLEQIELGVLDEWFRLNPPMDSGKWLDLRQG